MRQQDPAAHELQRCKHRQLVKVSLDPRLRSGRGPIELSSEDHRPELIRREARFVLALEGGRDEGALINTFIPTLAAWGNTATYAMWGNMAVLDYQSVSYGHSLRLLRSCPGVQQEAFLVASTKSAAFYGIRLGACIKLETARSQFWCDIRQRDVPTSHIRIAFLNGVRDWKY